jgi:cytochrome c oxidase subunit 2
VNGFQPIMPTFQGLVTEEQLLQLIAYVRSLSQPNAAPGAQGPNSATPPQGGRN